MAVVTCSGKSDESFFIVYIPHIRGPFEKFVEWWQCAAVKQREAVTVTSNFSGGGNVVVA
jgi:hypothetical protein